MNLWLKIVLTFLLASLAISFLPMLLSESVSNPAAFVVLAIIAYALYKYFKKRDVEKPVRNYCQQCGARIFQGDEFCPDCGKGIKG